MRRWLRECALALGALAVAAPPAAAATDGRAERALRTSEAAIGRAMGDWTFTDHGGRPLRAADLRGKPLVVSFVYTGCFAVCPAATQSLARAVRSAHAALGAGSFRVLSIGFNQPFDTPEALAAFARRQGIDQPDWLFVAPRTADVDALLARFGVSVERTAGGFDHLVQATIVGADGRIHRQVYGDAFELPIFVGPLKELLSGQADGSLAPADVWQKVKLYCTVYDPASGRYRFDYTLFVELLAGVTVLGGVAAFSLRELRRGRRLRG